MRRHIAHPTRAVALVEHQILQSGGFKLGIRSMAAIQ
jgi:hypothetical protein